MLITTWVRFSVIGGSKLDANGTGLVDTAASVLLPK